MKLTPVQRIICRKLQRPGVKRMTFLKTPRMGSTLFCAALLLYFDCHEGVDVLYYERTVEKAQEFHDKKLSRVLEASEKLQDLIRPDGRSGVQNKWSDHYLMNGAGIQLRSAFGKGTARATWIADRRATRQKDKKITSKASGAPHYDQDAPNEGIGSPGVFLRTWNSPSDAALGLILPGWTAFPESSVITREWPETESEFTTTIGAPAPIISGMPPF